MTILYCLKKPKSLYFQRFSDFSSFLKRFNLHVEVAEKLYFLYVLEQLFYILLSLPARRKAYKIFNLIRFMLYFWCSIIHSPWIRACACVVMGCQMRTSYLFRVSASLLWSLFLWLKKCQILPTFKELVFYVAMG